MLASITNCWSLRHLLWLFVPDNTTGTGTVPAEVGTYVTGTVLRTGTPMWLGLPVRGGRLETRN
jgi:hypothetical protein